MNTMKPLSKTTLALHWLVAMAMLGLVGLGWYMAEFKQYQYYHLHKSIGLLVIVLVLARVGWRIRKGWPEHVVNYSASEVLLSKIVHWVLLLSTLLMPIWGMLYSGGSGHGFGIFGLEIFPSNHSHEDPSVIIPLSEFWSNLGHVAHRYNGYIFISAIALHIIGALKHHIIDKDFTLKRMLGKNPN
ncbi:cytochrome b [Agarilytica rhodophyticola]|uniref:cytochrome b n=1 Tax=Agarilytica rhodophyticola TaxID=1737490 RepID=UPI000B34983C|nr:cytochrome b [Agarilytica rhodophyticola]